VVHYVPAAGGVVGGYAICGDPGRPDLGDLVLSQCDIEALASDRLSAGGAAASHPRRHRPGGRAPTMAGSAADAREPARDR
jgi:hypothetical protein